MLKEYFFLALTLSVLAVLAALTLHEKCCRTGKRKDLESNQEEDNQPGGLSLFETGRQEDIELASDQRNAQIEEPKAGSS